MKLQLKCRKSKKDNIKYLENSVYISLVDNVKNLNDSEHQKIFPVTGAIYRNCLTSRNG